MTKYTSFRFNVLAKYSLEERINRWCKKNSGKFKPYSALQMQEYKFQNGKTDSLKLKLTDKPRTLFDIVITSKGVVNKKWYKFMFPENYKLFVNLFYTYFKFADIIAKAIIYPDKYPNTNQFLKDWVYNKGSFKLICREPDLRRAFSFLTDPSYFFRTHYISLNMPSHRILEHNEYLEQLYENSQVMIEITQKYKDHPMIQLLELQVF